jgi:hypothetical protein
MNVDTNEQGLDRWAMTPRPRGSDLDTLACLHRSEDLVLGIGEGSTSNARIAWA